MNRFSPRSKRVVGLAFAGYLVLGGVLSMVAPSIGKPMLALVIAPMLIVGFFAALGK